MECEHSCGSNRSTNLLDMGTARHHDSCRGYEILEYPLLRTAEPPAASLAQTPYLHSHRQRPHNALSCLPCTQRMTADDQNGCHLDSVHHMLSYLLDKAIQQLWTIGRDPCEVHSVSAKPESRLCCRQPFPYQNGRIARRSELVGIVPRNPAGEDSEERGVPTRFSMLPGRYPTTEHIAWAVMHVCIGRS
jgi:hypothetical protein